MAKQRNGASQKRKQKSTGKIRNRFRQLLLQKAANEGHPISLREVARQTGFSVATWSDWFNDRVTRYDASKLIALCEFLNCTPGDLLEYVTPQKGD